MGARVLITGLAGFTGRYVAAAVAARGDTVVDPHAVATEFDLTRPDTVHDMVAAAAADHVIHLAAISFVGHGEAAAFYAVNTVGTVTLLDALAAAAHPVRSVVVASSANIYGNTAVSPLTEDQPLAPANHYAASKVALEALVGQRQGAVSTVVTRPFNYTGRGQSLQFLVPKIVDHFIRRAPVIELGNLDVERDFSDVRDVADAYARLLDAPGGTVVNLCSGMAHSLRSVIATCTEITGHTIEVSVNPAFVRANEVRTLVGSTARIDRITGGGARRPFADTLRWMLDGRE